MFILECKTPDGETLYWELSKSIPRDADGEPVDEGFVKRQGPNEIYAVAELDALDVIVSFLKKRSDAEIRVMEVEQALKAAEERGAAPDRRIKPRNIPAKTGGVDYGRPVDSSATKSSSGGFPIGPVLILAVLAAAVWFFFLR